MPDWAGLDGAATERRYRAMGEREVHGVSPSYERLCLGVADDPELIARLDTLPPPKRQPNLLLGAVRFLGGPIEAYQPFRTWVLEQWQPVSETMLERRTQTNEPRRCATLLPVLSALPQPLALVEIGASAGLCLYPDRYVYRYLTAEGEHVVGDGPVEFRCAVSGPAPLPMRRPDVVWRAGLDLNPLDVRDDEDMRWLEALIWPEQLDRFEVLRGAVGVARADPPRVERGDLMHDLPALLDDAPAEATLVLFHSAVLAYLSAEDRAAFAAQVHELATSRPLVWVANEAPGVVAASESLRGNRARFVLTRDDAALALTGPHGQSLDWLA